MTTVRVQSVNDANEAEELKVDLRGDAFVGDKEGDHHKTLEEIDVDESSELVTLALEFGEQFNAFFLAWRKEKIKGLDPAAAALIPTVCLRVMDKVAPKD